MANTNRRIANNYWMLAFTGLLGNEEKTKTKVYRAVSKMLVKSINFQLTLMVILVIIEVALGVVIFQCWEEIQYLENESLVEVVALSVGVVLIFATVSSFVTRSAITRPKSFFLVGTALSFQVTVVIVGLLVLALGSMPFIYHGYSVFSSDEKVPEFLHMLIMTFPLAIALALVISLILLHKARLEQ